MLGRRGGQREQSQTAVSSVKPEPEHDAWYGPPTQPLVQLSQPSRDLLVRYATQFPGTIQHVKAAKILSSGLLQSHRIRGGIYVVLEPQG